MDAQTINQQTSLVDLVGGLKRSGRYHVGPCPFCGGRDRFNVKEVDGEQLWICRQCGDGRYHDAVSFLMKRDGLTFGELLKQNGGDQRPATSDRRRPARPVAMPAAIDAPPDDAWQAAAAVVVGDSVAYLRGQSPDADRAWLYLITQRGLSDGMIERAQLGYNPAWRQIEGVGWLAPGITIPCFAGGKLWYVNVRTTAAARAASEAKGRDLGKYHALPGSKLKALYRADSLLTAREAIVTEGELDALLVATYLPEGWASVTMGSAGTLPDNPAWLRYFAAIRRVYVIMDNDQAGGDGLRRWRELLPWVDSIPVPAGSKDATDAWIAGYAIGKEAGMRAAC
jgi:DNA primase